jgi:hypothetical protein
VLREGLRYCASGHDYTAPGGAYGIDNDTWTEAIDTMTRTAHLDATQWDAYPDPTAPHWVQGHVANWLIDQGDLDAWSPACVAQALEQALLYPGKRVAKLPALRFATIVFAG